MKKLLTPDDVCELLTIEKSTLYAWTSKKRIPYRKLGGIRFDEDEILRWLKLRKSGLNIDKLEERLKDYERNKNG
jgi:excisionase family DNA binding protein